MKIWFMYCVIYPNLTLFSRQLTRVLQIMFMKGYNAILLCKFLYNKIKIVKRSCKCSPVYTDEDFLRQARSACPPCEIGTLCVPVNSYSLRVATFHLNLNGTWFGRQLCCRPQSVLIVQRCKMSISRN
jgi:hypothetical protein